MAQLSTTTTALSEQVRSNLNAAALAAQCRTAGGHFLTQAVTGKRCDVVCASVDTCSSYPPATCRNGWKAFGSWGGAVYSYGNECTTAAEAAGFWCCCNTNGCPEPVFRTPS